MRFSPSSLSVFRDCPRCFWNEQINKVKRPRGIFPSLPGGMDLVLKTYADTHRENGTQPADLEGIGVLFPDLANLKKWRNWRTAPQVVIGGHTLSGGIDDLIQHPDGRVSPLDFKTRGAAPKDGASEEYYGPQLDAYHLLLEDGAGLRCTGRGYLNYYWPERVVENGVVMFNRTIVQLDTVPARAVKLVNDAAACLAGPIPEPSENCEYCPFVNQRA